jgi:hypothetical protein
LAASFPKADHISIELYLLTFGRGCPSRLRLDVKDGHDSVFRQGFCRAPDCGAIFLVCSHCDRGQAYCSLACRNLARKLQHRQANRRHQQSQEGRLDHRDRQRAYRLRLVTARVTDQAYKPLTACATMAKPSSLPLKKPPQAALQAVSFYLRFSTNRAIKGVVCHFCGKPGRFINPFAERK